MQVGFGQVNGVDDQFSPVDGDSPTGGHGPLGSNIDGLSCDASMANNGYHIHFTLALFYNGVQIAIPDGAGMADPAGEGPFNGVPNQTEYTLPGSAGCFYEMHTHDPSGVVHVEVPNPNNVPVTQSITTLGQFLDIWGQRTDSLTYFGPYSGPVTVYTSGQVYRGDSNNGYVYSGTYTLYTGDLRQIPIYSHEVIWIMVGTGNPTRDQLPNVDFYEEF